MSKSQAYMARKRAADPDRVKGWQRAWYAANPGYAHFRCMRARCLYPSNPSFADYGGRGIRVCERWSTYRAFIADMGDPPPGASLDRIDNDRGYEPGNCRWATPKQQARNRRSNVAVRAFGETKTPAEWSEDPRCTVAQQTIRGRLARGVPAEAAITDPPMSPRESTNKARAIRDGDA